MEAAVAFPTVPFANAGSKFEKVYNSVVNRLKESSNLATHYSVDYSVYDNHFDVTIAIKILTILSLTWIMIECSIS